MDPQERDELILSLAPNVAIISTQVWRKTPQWMAREDLVAAGWIGAIRAVDRWSPERGVLSTFADHHIRGAMLDYLRSIDPMKRDQRKAYKKAVAAGEPAVGLHLVSLAAVPSAARLQDRSFRAVDDRRSIESIFRRAHLSQREESIVRRVFLQEETAIHIARGLKCHETNVAQIKFRAMAVGALQDQSGSEYWTGLAY